MHFKCFTFSFSIIVINKKRLLSIFSVANIVCLCFDVSMYTYMHLSVFSFMSDCNIIVEVPMSIYDFLFVSGLAIRQILFQKVPETRKPLLLSEIDRVAQVYLCKLNSFVCLWAHALYFLRWCNAFLEYQYVFTFCSYGLVKHGDIQSSCIVFTVAFSSSQLQGLI